MDLNADTFILTLANSRFLAIVLPSLTICTHTLLALSFALPDTLPEYRAFWSLAYNILAAGSSILGLIGALRLIPSLLSIYTYTHTVTLSFVTLGLANLIIPFDLFIVNPVVPAWSVDENAICRDIDAGMGWDEEWLVKCSKNFYLVTLVVAWAGLFLMLAQWWALATVRRWEKEVRYWRIRKEVDIERVSGELVRDLKGSWSKKVVN